MELGTLTVRRPRSNETGHVGLVARARTYAALNVPKNSNARHVESTTKRNIHKRTSGPRRREGSSRTGLEANEGRANRGISAAAAVQDLYVDCLVH